MDDTRNNEQIEMVGAPALAGDFVITTTKGKKDYKLTTEDISAKDDTSKGDDLKYKVIGNAATMKGVLKGANGKALPIVETDADGNPPKPDPKAEPVVTFTQTMLENGEVTFEHDGKSSDPGKFKISVSDEYGIETDAREVKVLIVGAMMDVAQAEQGKAVNIKVLENDDKDAIDEGKALEGYLKLLEKGSEAGKKVKKSQAPAPSRSSCRYPLESPPSWPDRLPSPKAIPHY